MAPPNTPGNPWLVKGILAFLAAVGLTLAATATLGWSDLVLSRHDAGVLGIGSAAGDQDTVIGEGEVTREAPTAAATTTAGNSLTITASPAVAGTVTAGAAVGGSVNITAGAAALKTSGTASGGDVNITGGAGVGTNASGGDIILQGGAETPGGAVGTVRCPGAGGVNTNAIGDFSVASAAGTTAYGYDASASSLTAIALGYGSTASGQFSVALGGSNGAVTIARLDSSLNVVTLPVIRKDDAETFNISAGYKFTYVGMPSYIFTNELDTTQAALANASQNWTITVAANVVTVNTIAAHKFSVGQYISTDADWTDNAFMASLTDQLITSVTSTTFTFALTQANQGATTETNAGAGITPGDYVITLPTGGTFFVDEIGVEASLITGAITTHPTIQFGNSGARDAFYAPALLTQTTATRTREVLTPIAVYAGQTTLSAGMTVASTVATAYKIRFYWKGVFIEDE